MRIIEGVIQEYDIECACLSMLIQKGMISEELFLDLKEGDKDERNILIGKIQIGNDDVKSVIADGIKGYVDQLINSLNNKNNVLEVSKDAIFILNDVPDLTKMDDFVNFNIKGKYYLCIEFEITKSSKQMVKIYKNREELKVRFSSIDISHEAYPYLFELLNHRMNNNTRSFYRVLPKFKIALFRDMDKRLIKAVSNDYLYEVIEEII